MSRSTISTFDLFQTFPDAESARVYKNMDVAYPKQSLNLKFPLGVE